METIWWILCNYFLTLVREKTQHKTTRNISTTKHVHKNNEQPTTRTKATTNNEQQTTDTQHNHETRTTTRHNVTKQQHMHMNP